MLKELLIAMLIVTGISSYSFEMQTQVKEIEKNALNDVLRTIMIINNKIEEIIEIQKQQELAISYLRGMIAGSESE